MKHTLQIFSFAAFIFVLSACNTKQMIVYNIAGSWKLTSQTDTSGLDAPIGDWKITYNFDKCSGSAADCGGSYSVVSTLSTGPAPKPTSFKWSLDGSYMDIKIGTAAIKFNVMEVSKKKLTLQLRDFPREHMNFERQ